METWVVSDTHFGHANATISFKRADGSPLRPFASVEETDEYMIKQWNDRVKPNDVVWHLGDVVINKKHIPVLNRLNGIKHLIIGNHDYQHQELLTPYFESMSSMTVKSNVIMTHIPIHPMNIARFGANFCGHIHDQDVLWEVNGKMEPDPRYLVMCVEHHDFAPVLMEDAKNLVKQRQERANYNPPQAWSNGSKPKS